MRNSGSATSRQRLLAAIVLSLVSCPLLASDAGLLGDVISIPGTGVGAIPDGIAGSPTCGDGNGGTPLNVNFNVPPFPGQMIASVTVGMTLSPAHTFVGDLTARLIDPSGTRERVLFGRILATTAGGCGDSSDFAGPYLFADGVAPPSGGIWQEGTARGTAEALTSGSYLPTASGGAGAVNPAPPTDLAVFVGMTSAQSTGTWTLRFVDSGDQDTGTVAAATLLIALTPDTDTIFVDGFDTAIPI